MLINNPLKMNDWKYSHFIIPIIIIQILTLFLSLLNNYHYNIPILTFLVAFIYLTFIPGYLILRIFKIHNLGSVKSVLYAVGLSIFSLMFLGFLLNLTVLKPISLLNLTIIYTLFTIILSVLSYTDKEFSNPSFIDSNILFSPTFLFLLIIPFLSIFGTYLVNNYNFNLVSVFLMLIIALVAFLVVFNKIHKKFNPFIVWIITISLLFSSSLISRYIWGWDIQNEYYLANMVLNNSYWNFNIGDAYNAMLSVVMVGPIYSIFTGIDLVYVLKIVYPLIFSLVPLGLYELFKEQSNNKVAFLSVFLFVSFSTFFIILPSEGREMIAEFFLVLFLLVILTKGNKSKLVLPSIFGVGIIVSHYSLTYFFIFILVASYIIILLYNLIITKFSYKEALEVFLDSIKDYPINLFIIVVLLLFSYLWYQNIAGGSILNLANIFGFIVENFFNKLQYFQTHLNSLIPLILLLIILIIAIMVFVRLKSKGDKKNGLIKDNLKFKHYLLPILSIITFISLIFLVGNPQSIIIAIQRYLNFVLVYFALIGLVFVVLNLSKNSFKFEYKVFSIISFLILIAGIFLPVFENAFNITRIFHLTFIFLSPICIYGAIIIFNSITKHLKRSNGNSIKIVSIILVIFMLFNTGFFSVLLNTSIPVHLNSESDTYPRFDYQETVGAQWLYENRISDKIYADDHGVLLFKKYLSSVPTISNYNNENNSYIFERKLNKNNTFIFNINTNSKEKSKTYRDLSYLIPKNRIYDNGQSKIFFKG